MESIVRKIIVFVLVLSFIQGASVFNFLYSGQINAQSSQLFYPDSEAPLILPRSSWDNNQSLNSLLTWLPQNQEFPSDWQTVERIIIHDTGCDTSNPSCNNNINPIATIQSIYRYHAVTRGWGDIGYNYIIDQQGRIYEGRFGGNGVRGAHTYYDRMFDNFNYGSIGIVLLGNYANQDISPTMYESLGRLIGWLSATNNLDPQGTKSSLIWNSSKGGFISPYSGPVVAGHKDVEPGNPDPGKIDLAKVRTLAAQYKQKYQNMVYQTSASSKVYQLLNGVKKSFETINDFLAQGGHYQKLAILNQEQLDLFSESRFFKYPNGSLLQVNSSTAVWLIEDGKKRNLNITAQQFTKLGFDWSKIKKTTLDDLNYYPSGLDVIYGPDKDLLKDELGRVYFIDNGRKRWITSDTLFRILGFSWKKVKNSQTSFLAAILDGTPMSYPSGTLVKGSGPTVYLIDNGQKRQFLSAQSFVMLGYQWNKIVQVSDEELARYMGGAFISYKDGTIVRQEGEPTAYLISGGKKLAFVSNQQFQNMGYKASQVLMVSQAELNQYPAADYVKYPDGTLVQKIGDINVYQVKNGLANLIPDITTFKKLKLSWSKVLKISADDFNKLFASAELSSASAADTRQIANQPAGQPSASPPTSPAASQPNIRIGIWEVPVSQTEIIFSGSGPYDVYDKSGQLLASKSSGEHFSVNVVNSSSVFARLVPKAGTILEVVSYQDKPAWNPNLNYNKFRGSLELVFSQKSGKLWLVNELPLEEYLKGVAEANQGMAGEYLKTMSVAARTYAYYYLKQNGKYGSDEVYHLTNTTRDQLYKGYGREPYASDIVTAAQATFGEVIMYNGQPAVTAYSAGASELITSGSRSACSVWGGKYCQSGYEYLNGGVKDPVGTDYSYTSCSGANHCVGLSGAGTRRWAALGRNYKEILMYYYPGTSIQKIY